MALVDALVVLGIFGAFSFLILSRLKKQRPEYIDKVKEWMSNKEQPNLKTQMDRIEQIHEEKRSVM